MIDPQKVLGFKPYSLGKCFETPPCSYPTNSTLLLPRNTALLLPFKLALIAPSFLL